MLHHVDHGGDGPALVLLHAFPLGSSTWDRLVPLVTGRSRVVTIDLPGLGRSAVPGEDPDMGTVARLVLDVLDDLGISEAYVFGVSTGGYVALRLAADAPARVRGLVLGSTTTQLVEPDVPAQRQDTADEIERTGSTTSVAGSADEGIGPTAHRDQPELVHQLRRIIADADPAGVAWMARAIASRTDTTEVLRVYAGPVLLVFGEEDEATPPSRGEEMLATRGGDAHLVELPATGHLTALESPEAVAAHLVEFLSG